MGWMHVICLVEYLVPLFLITNIHKNYLINRCLFIYIMFMFLGRVILFDFEMLLLLGTKKKKRVLTSLIVSNYEWIE